MNAKSDQTAPIIQIKGLTKSFGNESVLRGISLDFYHGETVVVLGASGSGKSVLMGLLVGLIEPDAGQIVIEGQDVTAFEVPIATLSCGAKRILIESRFVSTTSARVAFGDVRANRAHGPV